MSGDSRTSELSLPPPPGTVQLRQAGQFLHITPPVARLDDWIYTVLHRRAHDATHGASIGPLEAPLIYKVNRYGHAALACGAGLKTLVKELLERNGLRVEMCGEPAALTAPAWGQLATIPRVDHALLHFVRHHDWGLVWYERQGKVSIVKLIAQVALAWPEQNIIVVPSRIMDARRLARRLSDFLPGVGLVTGRNRKDQRGRRVVVVTPRYMRRGDVEVERRDICVAVNPAELFGLALGNGGDVLNSLRTARFYGLVAADQKSPPRLRDLLTAYFGPQEALIPRHGYQSVAVKVVFSPVRGGGRPPAHRDHALIKRLGVHEHHLRNRRVCNLAVSLVHEARAVLEADYPHVAACLGEKVGRVGVLVDNVTHGLTLARRLRWPLVVGPVVNEEGLPEEDREWIDLGRDKGLRTRMPVVVTGGGMKRAGTFDVLIRADGGVELPDIPLVKLSAPDDRWREMLLVDFRDENHRLLRKWSRLRRTAYDDAGWVVVGDEMSNLERFVATRPGVV
jgi:hypothetical protein